MVVPSLLLRQSVTNGSLRNVPDGVRSSIESRGREAISAGMARDGRDVPAEARTGSWTARLAAAVSSSEVVGHEQHEGSR
jgi:hypothetical protein